MRILYMGLPLGAEVLRAAGHPPAAVLLGHPEAPGGRRARRTVGQRGALLLGKPNLRDARVLELVASVRPDVILSFFWPRLIPAEVLALAPRGAFGAHPSLLPRWRGPDPYFWTVRAGDAVTGVTLHRLEADFDTGAIVERVEVPLDPRWDAWRLARVLDRPALRLLCACADRLARGEALEGEPQPAQGATEAPMPDDADLAIDWDLSATEVVRLVRAAAPEPGARARIGEVEVDVLAAEVATSPAPRALRPSEAYAGPEGVTVRAGEGAVVLSKVRSAEDGGEVLPAELLGL